MIDVHPEVVDDERDLTPTERCCFCRKLTRHWYLPKDVACCQDCAKKADRKDVPTKKVWCRREQIAFKGVLE